MRDSSSEVAAELLAFEMAIGSRSAACSSTTWTSSEASLVSASWLVERRGAAAVHFVDDVDVE